MVKCTKNGAYYKPGGTCVKCGQIEDRALKEEQRKAEAARVAAAKLKADEDYWAKINRPKRSDTDSSKKSKDNGAE